MLFVLGSCGNVFFFFFSSYGTFMFKNSFPFSLFFRQRGHTLKAWFNAISLCFFSHKKKVNQTRRFIIPSFLIIIVFFI